MRLKGTRIAVVNEASAGTRINDGVMKEFTGGTDYITARKLYGDAESFIPKCKPARILKKISHVENRFVRYLI